MLSGRYRVRCRCGRATGGVRGTPSRNANGVELRRSSDGIGTPRKLTGTSSKSKGATRSRQDASSSASSSPGPTERDALTFASSRRTARCCSRHSLSEAAALAGTKGTRRSARAPTGSCGRTTPLRDEPRVSTRTRPRHPRPRACRVGAARGEGGEQKSRVLRRAVTAPRVRGATRQQEPRKELLERVAIPVSCEHAVRFRRARHGRGPNRERRVSPQRPRDAARTRAACASP